jgi:hypothetical protein
MTTVIVILLFFNRKIYFIGPLYLRCVPYTRFEAVAGFLGVGCPKLYIFQSVSSLQYGKDF